MRTADALRIEFRRLLDEDRLDEAEALLGRIEPLTDEEWLNWLNDVPLDDEALTSKEVQRLDAAALRRANETSAKLRAG